MDGLVIDVHPYHCVGTYLLCHHLPNGCFLACLKDLS
jgi:hypothetical protein